MINVLDFIKRYKKWLIISGISGGLIALMSQEKIRKKTGEVIMSILRQVKLPDNLNDIWDFLTKKSQKFAQIFGKTRQEVENQLVPIKFMGHKIRVHRLVKDKFLAVADELQKLKIPYQFKDVQVYNWRYSRRTENKIKRLGEQATNRYVGGHAFGFAVDINPSTNPQIDLTKPGARAITDIPKVVVDVFKKYGFDWGGDWEPKSFDPMHFEVKV